MPDNSLLGRCTVAYAETVDALDYPQHTTRSRQAGTRAVIEHLAAELVVLNNRSTGRLSAHDAAQWLLDQLKAEVIELRPTTKEPA
jgi:hypothetical protein